jgi:hypothetical protein
MISFGTLSALSEQHDTVSSAVMYYGARFLIMTLSPPNVYTQLFFMIVVARRRLFFGKKSIPTRYLTAWEDKPCGSSIPD